MATALWRATMGKLPQPLDDESSSQRRVAVVFMVLCVAASCAFVISQRTTGKDLIETVWAPGRALLRGVSPFDPTRLAYQRAYRVTHIAPFNTPSAYLLLAPLLAVRARMAVDLMRVVNPLLVWSGVLILIRPRTAAGFVAAGVAGAGILATYASQDLELLGQLSPLAFVGVALLLVSWDARRGLWWSVAGTVLISLKPQYAAPVFLLLVMCGAWRVAIRAAVVLAVTSVPALVLFLRAAGSISTAWATVGSNLRFFDHLNEDNLAYRGNTRIDLLGLLAHLRGPALNSLGWSLLVLGLASALLALGLRRRCQPALAAFRPDAVVATMWATYLVVSLYHQPYDAIVLFAGPLVALGAVVAGRPVGRGELIVLAGGLLLEIAEILARYPGRLVPSFGPFALTGSWANTLPSAIACVAAVVSCRSVGERH
jgi:hypothetical protein